MYGINKLEQGEFPPEGSLPTGAGTTNPIRILIVVAAVSLLVADGIARSGGIARKSAPIPQSSIESGQVARLPNRQDREEYGQDPKEKESGQVHKSPHGQDRKDKEGALSLHSDLVLVNVTVTNSEGHYIQGLKAGDFALVEDGKPQSVDSFSSEEAPFAAAILIDMSGSMEYKFGMVRGAAASFLEHIRDDDQVAVYGFNNKIRQFQDFSDSRNITDYIWDAKAEESTKLFDCMQTAIEALEKRSERRRAILVITDGWDTMSGATKESVTKRALAAGVTLYTVDLTDDELFLVGSDTMALRRGRSTLQDFATDTGGRYVHSPKGDKLEEAFDNVVDELRNQYTLTYYSTNEKRDGRWRAIGVSVPRPGVSVRARRGYYAPKK